MIDDLAVGVAFVALAVAAFVGAVRVGMLVGLRVGRALEAGTADGNDETAESDPDAAPQPEIAAGRGGREEKRGE